MLDGKSVVDFAYKFYLMPLLTAGTIDLKQTREPFPSFSEKLYKVLADFKASGPVSEADTQLAIKLRGCARRVVAIIAWARDNNLNDPEYRSVRLTVCKALSSLRIEVPPFWPADIDYGAFEMQEPLATAYKVTLDVKPAFEKKVFVYDCEVWDGTSDLVFVSAIKRAEGELEDIRKIKTPSRYLNELIASKELQLSSLVDFFDKRVKHDTARKDDSANTLESGPEF